MSYLDTPALEVITNNVPRRLLSSQDVPGKVLRSDFDWASEEEEYFKYKDRYYALSEFQTAPVKGWDGICEEGFFCGVLIRFKEEEVVVGRYYC